MLAVPTLARLFMRMPGGSFTRWKEGSVLARAVVRFAPSLLALATAAGALCLRASWARGTGCRPEVLAKLLRGRLAYGRLCLSFLMVNFPKMSTSASRLCLAIPWCTCL